MLRSAKYGVYAAVLGGLVAAPVVAFTSDTSVHLTVDGKDRTVSTSADSVGAMLDDEGLSADTHDIVAPTTSTQLKDGMHIVLRRGRLLHLNVDGKAVNVWTTAPTVSVALAQLGYSGSDFVSVSRSKRLPLDPTKLAIRTPRVVTVVHDGRHDTVSTTEPTIDALLSDLSITRDGDDRVSPAPSTATSSGLTVTLQRVGVTTVTRTKTVKFSTTRKNDKSRYKGDTDVITSGRDGKARVTYEITTIDGKQSSQKPVKTVTLTAPRTKVLAIGTKKIVVRDPESAQAFAKSYMDKEYGWGDSEFGCLVSMWNRESGWRTSAANPSGAYGIPQALPGSKMSSAGPDWQNNAETQVKWGLGYIKSRYSTPCGAWGFWQNHNYY